MRNSFICKHLWKCLLKCAKKKSFFFSLLVWIYLFSFAYFPSFNLIICDSLLFYFILFERSFYSNRSCFQTKEFRKCRLLFTPKWAYVPINSFRQWFGRRTIIWLHDIDVDVDFHMTAFFFLSLFLLFSFFFIVYINQSDSTLCVLSESLLHIKWCTKKLINQFWLWWQ